MKLSPDGKIRRFVQTVKTKWRERSVFTKEPIGEPLSQKTQSKPITKEELAENMISIFAEKMKALKDFDPAK